MANPALAVVESALRTRKLDRTLTTALPPLDRFDAAALGATDVTALDGCLGGGLPRGQVSELAAAARPGMSRHVQTAGRTTLLLQMMAAATRRGELVALIDTCDGLDVASAIAAGVEVNRFLWVRGAAIVSSPAMVHPTTTIDRLVDRALKAVTLVLQAGGFGLVAIDLADIPLPVLKRLPFTTWLRVQRMVEGRDTACVLLVPEPLARSAGGVTLSLTGRAAWGGTADRSRRLTGLDLQVSVISPRRRVSGAVTLDARFDESRTTEAPASAKAPAGKQVSARAPKP